jgi:anti-sigma B factor antagonist
MDQTTQQNPPSFILDRQNDITIIRFNHDSFDRVEIQDIRDQLRDVVNQTQPPRFIIDFAHVSFMSSIILGVIMGIHLNICKREGVLTICGMNEMTLRVFKITKLDKVLTIFDDCQQAIASLEA